MAAAATATATAPTGPAVDLNIGSSNVVFDLDAPSFSSDHFRMFEFKVKRCPRVKPHDWACCPFAHMNEKAKRRDPRFHKYSGTACPEFRRNGCCRRSEQCPFAHGIFECWMHPSRYRTQMCSEVLECKRRVCFFAHTESELRRPVDDATWMQQHSVINGLEGPDTVTAYDAKAFAATLSPHEPSSPARIRVAPDITVAAAAPHGDMGGAPGAVEGAWPELQQLLASGQCDATHLLQLARTMSITNASSQAAAGAQSADAAVGAATSKPDAIMPDMSSEITAATDALSGAGATTANAPIQSDDVVVE